MIIFLKFLSLVALLCCSAFFSASEAAIFHLPVITIDKLVRRSKRLLILKRRELLLGTILFGNTLVNVGASIIAEQIVFQIFHNSYIAILTGVMTFIILVCGEITPKLYSIRNAEPIAIRATPILNFLRYILLPITVPLEAIISLIAPRHTSGFTKDEFRTFINSEEKLSKGAKTIIFNMLKFKKFTVADLMTPISKLNCLSDSTKLNTDLIAKLPHSRIPVYDEENPIKIKGILYIKDLLKINQYKGQSITEIMREPIFVPPGMKASEMLMEFRRQRTHIAVVVDTKKPSGQPDALGIITLDDILSVIIAK